MDVSSAESPRAPEGGEGTDAPDDRTTAAAGAAVAPAAGKKGKKGKKTKAPKEPKGAKPAKAPKDPKAAKPPKAAKEPEAAKEPKAPKAPKEPKPAKRATAGDASAADGAPPTGRRGRRAARNAPTDDARTDNAGPDQDIGWTATTDTGDEPTDPHDAGPDPDGDAVPVGAGSRKRLLGAATVGPLLLLAAIFLPTDRGSHGNVATAAPTSAVAPIDEGADAPADTEDPADAVPRFLVLIEQDLPPTTTVAPTTTASTTIARPATPRITAGESGTDASAETPHEAPAPEPTAATAPPIVVNTIGNEDTQLAVFLLTDGRRVEMAVPLRYFSLVPGGDPAQRTFDEEVAGHLLVRDRDGRYWGGDLDSEPALLYQLPSSKTIEPGPTTTAAARSASAATHATATGTTTTTEGHGETSGPTTTATETGAETTTTEAMTATTKYVREPFPLVVQGPVSVEDERVVRLLAALPGVASVLDLGRGAVIVSGEIDLGAILNVPGVRSAQPTSAG